MREYLYRGKTEKGEWIESKNIMLIHSEKKCYLWNGVRWVDIDYETIGQYTGLTDKNGKKIFEGDFIKVPYNTRPYKVYYNECNSLKIEDIYDSAIRPTQRAIDYCKCEVIGNIHDNPELLEVAKCLRINGD